MRKYANFSSNLAALKRAYGEDLGNEFISAFAQLNQDLQTRYGELLDK